MRIASYVFAAAFATLLTLVLVIALEASRQGALPLLPRHYEAVR